MDLIARYNRFIINDNNINKCQCVLSLPYVVGCYQRRFAKKTQILQKIVLPINQNSGAPTFLWDRGSVCMT